MAEESKAQASFPARAPQRATLLIAAGSSTIAFNVGFNYGAFGVVFFDQVFTVWVIATIVFVGSMVTDLPPHTWPRRALLLIPTLWLGASWVDTNLDLRNSDTTVLVITLVVTLVSLPFVAWFLVTAINSDFADLPRKFKQAVVATTAVFLVVGVVLGARNDTILTCDDFKVSGNDLPDNCTVTQP